MYIVKLPGGNYINLALVQSVQVDEERPTVVVHWQDARKVYHDRDAQAIVHSMDYHAAVNITKAEKPPKKFLILSIQQMQPNNHENYNCSLFSLD